MKTETDKLQEVRTLVNLYLRDGGDLKEMTDKCIWLLKDAMPKPAKVENKTKEPKADNKTEEPTKGAT